MAAKLPRLHAHLQQLGCDISILATDWFLCLYATSLPSEVGLPAEHICLSAPLEPAQKTGFPMLP
jgi:hypothetical protein